MSTVGGLDEREQEIRERDRLPWLETVDDDFRDGASPVRIVLLVLLGLGLLAAAIYGFSRYQAGREGSGAGGPGGVIAAQEGDYKVKPDDPGGLKVAGEGASAIATSDGAGPGNAAIDLKAVPEAPVAGRKAADVAPKAASSKAVAPVPASGGRLAAAPAARGSRAAFPAAAGGSIVQLGSFPQESAANRAWEIASKRFSYLAPLGKSVQKAEVGGRTVYRLRVNAGSAGQAVTLCGKLKVAGEACFIPNE